MAILSRLYNCLTNIGIFINPDENILLSDFIEDSLMFVSMIIEIEQEFDIEVSDDYFAPNRLTSLKDLEELVVSLTSSAGTEDNIFNGKEGNSNEDRTD